MRNTRWVRFLAPQAYWCRSRCPRSSGQMPAHSHHPQIHHKRKELTLPRLRLSGFSLTSLRKDRLRDETDCQPLLPVRLRRKPGSAVLFGARYATNFGARQDRHGVSGAYATVAGTNAGTNAAVDSNEKPKQALDSELHVAP